MKMMISRQSVAPTVDPPQAKRAASGSAAGTTKAMSDGMCEAWMATAPTQMPPIVSDRKSCSGPGGGKNSTAAHPQSAPDRAEPMIAQPRPGLRLAGP